MMKYLVLIFLIILLVILVFYYNNTREYFADCIIYKNSVNYSTDKYFIYGRLQLLYKYFMIEDKDEKKKIKDTYSLKIYNESNSINLDKLERSYFYEDKKITFNNLKNSDTEWANCSFRDSTYDQDPLYFNLMNKDSSKICDDIVNLKSDSVVNGNNDLLLLKIEFNDDNIELGEILPDKIKINKIRVVKYNKDQRKIVPFEEESHFINYFFKLDTTTLEFKPIKRNTMIYIFKNEFCNNIYEIDRTEQRCFNINEIGFESINFIDYNTTFGDNFENDLSECDDEYITSFDDIKEELKNKMFLKAKDEYTKCYQKISLNYVRDKDIYNSRNNNCVVPKTYLLQHCSYKKCNYHNKSCKYEKDKKQIKEYNDILDVDNFNKIEQENMFYIMDNSEKNYNTCKKYINYNTDFYKKIEAIDNDQIMLDNELNKFDDEKELYSKLDLLENVSQDNCIYILISIINKE
jgi:hypothetical protein